MDYGHELRMHPRFRGGRISHNGVGGDGDGDGDWAIEVGLVNYGWW